MAEKESQKIQWVVDSPDGSWAPKADFYRATDKVVAFYVGIDPGDAFRATSAGARCVAAFSLYTIYGWYRKDSAVDLMGDS